MDAEMTLTKEQIGELRPMLLRLFAGENASRELDALCDLALLALSRQDAPPVAWQVRYVDRVSGKALEWRNAHADDLQSYRSDHGYEVRELFASPPAAHLQREALENEFLTEVCDQLFGCFMERAYNDELGWHENCAICETVIDITKWVHAEHKPDCIINKVREYLKVHKPRSVPPALLPKESAS